MKALVYGGPGSRTGGPTHTAIGVDQSHRQDNEPRFAAPTDTSSRAMFLTARLGVSLDMKVPLPHSARRVVSFPASLCEEDLATMRRG